MHNVRVKFYLGQKKDCSLGDSTSDGSEKLLQRGRGDGQYICDFGEGGAHEIRHIFFFQKVSASHEGAVITMKDFSVFLGGDTRTELIKSAPENIGLSEDLSCQSLLPLP